MDGKNGLISRILFSELCKIMVNEGIFVGFWGQWSDSLPWIRPTLLGTDVLFDCGSIKYSPTKYYPVVTNVTRRAFLKSVEDFLRVVSSTHIKSEMHFLLD